MIRKLRVWFDYMQDRIMMVMGARSFPYIVTWTPPWRRAKYPTVIIFAQSECDFNTCVRDQVERLDAQTRKEQ